MYFENPSQSNSTFTVYSKSGCPNCKLVKQYIKDNHFLYYEINCDEYLIEAKEDFLSFIESKAGKSHRMFPMVFYNNRFIGGYEETKEYINNLLLSFEDIF